MTTDERPGVERTARKETEKGEKGQWKEGESGEKEERWGRKLAEHRDTITVLPLSLHENNISLIKDRDITNSGAVQGLQDSHVQAPGWNKRQDMRKHFPLQPQEKGHGEARAGHQ